MALSPIKKRLLTAAGVVLWLTGPELMYFSGSMAVRRPPLVGVCAVIVLGYPTLKNGRPHPLQRERMETGINAYLHNDCKRMVVSILNQTFYTDRDAAQTKRTQIYFANFKVSS